jgi:chromosome segregation ATPase
MAEMTKKDIFDTLSEFYGKVVEPRFDRIEKRLDQDDQKFRDLIDHFDKIHTKLDRLETEYYSIVAGIDRMERRLDHVDGRLDKIEIRLDTVDQKLDQYQNPWGGDQSG